MVIISELNGKNGLMDIIKSVKTPMIITPGPKEADGVRSLDEYYFFKQKIDAITMANFTKQAIDRLCRLDKYPSHYDQAVSKKANLYLNLSGIWEKSFGEGKEELFFQAYRHLTDLRGSSLDLSLVSEGLELIDAELAKAISILWSYMDAQGVVDEQRAYNIIAEHASLLNLEFDCLIFVGFNHLSAVQVDMINCLSKEHTVMMPFPEGSLVDLDRFDWPVWLEGYEADIYQEIKSLDNQKVTFFSQNRLAQAMIKSLGAEKEKKDIVFLTEEISSPLLFELPFESGEYRAVHDLFAFEIERLSNELRKLGKRKPSYIHDWLNEKSVRLLQEQNKKPGSLLGLKIIHLFVTALGELEENFVGEELVINSFTHSILKSVCLLNAPRTSVITYHNDKVNEIIYSLSDLKFQRLDNPDIIIKNEYLPVVGGVERGNVELSSFLSTIGPVKNSRLNNQMNLAWMLNSLYYSKANFFVEEGAEELDPRLFDLFGLSNRGYFLPTKLDLNKKQASVYVKKISSQFSASKFQRFIECPKKFEEQYLIGNNSFPKLERSLLPADLGKIQHQVIEYFFKRNMKNIDLEVVIDLTSELVVKYAIDQKKTLSDLNRLQGLNQISIAAYNGIMFLTGIREILPKANFEFEVDLSVLDDCSGRADLVIALNDSFIVLDFKKSFAGAKTAPFIEQFKSVQLPFYGEALQLISGKKCDGLGYIILEEPEKSSFFSLSNDSSFTDIFKCFKSCKKLENESGDFLAAFSSFKKDTISNIKKRVEEQTFSPKPLSKDTCKYCPAKLTCKEGR